MFKQLVQDDTPTRDSPLLVGLSPAPQADLDVEVTQHHLQLMIVLAVPLQVVMGEADVNELNSRGQVSGVAEE